MKPDILSVGRCHFLGSPGLLWPGGRRCETLHVVTEVGTLGRCCLWKRPFQEDGGLINRDTIGERALCEGGVVQAKRARVQWLCRCRVVSDR